MEGIKILSASKKCLYRCSLTHHDLTKRLTKRLTHASYSPFFLNDHLDKKNKR